MSIPVFLQHKEDAIIASFVKEKKRLLSFIKRRVSDQNDAEDILQDVFHQLIESFTPLQPIEKVSSWLFRVARNKIVDKYRKKKPVSFSEYLPAGGEEEINIDILALLKDSGDNPEEQQFSNIIWETLGNALEILPKEQSEVFIMHELEGKSFKEISEELNVSVNTLLSRKRYAVLFLRKELYDLYKEL